MSPEWALLLGYLIGSVVTYWLFYPIILLKGAQVMLYILQNKIELEDDEEEDS